MLKDRALEELQRIKRALSGADDAVTRELASDPEINRYITAIERLKDLGAFTVTVAKRGTVGVVENTVAVKSFDEYTEHALADAGIEIHKILGFRWVRVPTIIGPKEIISPRNHPKQRALYDRIRAYYENKKRSAKQLAAVDAVFVERKYVPCSYTQSWRDFGAAMLLPRSAVSHQDYRNSNWYLLNEAEAQEATV